MKEQSEAMVEVKSLSKSYGLADARIEVLKDIDVALKPAEICVILGPSGSGKSTFLNILGGLENPDAGQVLIDGIDIAQLDGNGLCDYRREQLGFVFQFYNLVCDLTIRENIEVTAHLSKNPMDIDNLLHALGLWEQRDKFPRQVSGGQQQRCAIGRALAKRPSLLLCDEPTGALDYKTSKEILALMEQVNRDYGCTVVIVTHNNEIARMAHRVLRLHDGRLVSDELNEHICTAADLEW